MKRRKPWRKILYERQDYPDNYVDASFLEEMKKNGTIFLLKFLLLYIIDLRSRCSLHLTLIESKFRHSK